MTNTDMKMNDNESLETFRHTQIYVLISLNAKSDPHEIAFIFFIFLMLSSGVPPYIFQ